MAITFSIPDTEVIITTGQVTETAQNLVNAIRLFEDDFQMMSNSKILNSGGKFPLGGGVFTEIIMVLLEGNEGGWTVRFEDEGTEHTSITGGTFLATDSVGASRNVTTNPALTINQSVSGTLVETGVSGLTAPESAQLDAINSELTNIEGIHGHGNLMRGMWAMLAGHISGAAIGQSGTAAISNMMNTKTRITMDFDEHGNRISVTFNDLT